MRPTLRRPAICVCVTFSGFTVTMKKMLKVILLLFFLPEQNLALVGVFIVRDKNSFFLN
jgi:hypothetical protein